MDMKNWLKGNVLVIAHVGDIDACSSFIAFSELFNGDFDYHVTGSINKEAKKIISMFKFKLKTKVDLSKYDKLLLVDTQKNILPREFQNFKDIALIDHHKFEGKKPKGVIDSAAVSTTQIIYSLYKKYKQKISKRAARAIIYGIIADTGGLRFAKTDTFGIVHKLLRSNKLQYRDLLEALSSEVEQQERIAWLKAGKRLEIQKIGNKLLVISYIKAFESSAASKLIILGADIALVVARKNKKAGAKRSLARRNGKDSVCETRIVGRARKGFDLAKIFINASKQIGGVGGGHPSAAAINISADKEKETLKFIITWLKSQK